MCQQSDAPSFIVHHTPVSLSSTSKKWYELTGARVYLHWIWLLTFVSLHILLKEVLDICCDSCG
jgi:hypothetical protein